jgi:peptidyl-prolyl cis-trans isomerase A (cyclophilin A)
MNMYKFILFVASVIFISCSHPEYKYPHVMIDTRFGDIEVELYPDKAPKTVAAFLSGIEEGLYTNGSFYRVLKAEEFPTDFNTGIIQGGIWQAATKLHAPVPGIVHESTRQTGLSHTDGTISMARKDTGTATTEFFICIGDQSSLDFGKGGNSDGQGFAAFGKVFKGMDIVRKIQSQKSHGENFDEKIGIREIKRL